MKQSEVIKYLKNKIKQYNKKAKDWGDSDCTYYAAANYLQNAIYALKETH